LFLEAARTEAVAPLCLPALPKSALLGRMAQWPPLTQLNFLSKKTNHCPTHSARKSATERQGQKQTLLRQLLSWRKGWLIFLLNSGAFFFLYLFNIDIDYKDVFLNCQHGGSGLGNKATQLENKDPSLT
jgi:hypothetical protein